MMLSACGGNSGNASNEGNTSTSSNSTVPSEQSSPSSANEVTSKEVKLKMVLLGAEPTDFKLVLGEFNKKVKEKLTRRSKLSFWTGPIGLRSIH